MCAACEAKGHSELHPLIKIPRPFERIPDAKPGHHRQLVKATITDLFGPAPNSCAYRPKKHKEKLAAEAAAKAQAEAEAQAAHSAAPGDN